MAYDLATLRTIIGEEGRNAKDSSMYPAARRDRCLMRAMREWGRETKSVRNLTTVQLTVGTATFAAPCRPEFILDMELTLAGQTVSPKIEVTSIEAVRSATNDAAISLNGTPTLASGRPRLVAAADLTNWQTFPVADQPYTLNIWWWTQVTTWTAGTSTAMSFTLTDEELDSIAALGAVYYLQRSEPANTALADKAHGQFLRDAKLFALRGGGGRGVQVLTSDPAPWKVRHALGAAPPESNP